MKRIAWILGLTAMAAFVILVVPSTHKAVATQGIVGSHHDASQYDQPNHELCSHCHVPHNTSTDIVDSPLWSHDLSQKVYELYQRSSLDHSPTQPDGTSKLCLGCHDGTVATGNYDGKTGTHFITGDAAVGAGPSDLKNDHPISFTYDKALADADGGLFDPAVKTVTIGSNAWTKTGTVADVMLRGGAVQCTSCHDVHNDYVAEGGDNGGDPLLKMSVTNSALCFACHNK